jgi:pantoate--beta-alanine ligase
MRLNEEERLQALYLSKALFYIQENYLKRELVTLLEEARNLLNNSSLLTLEYLAVAQADTLVDCPEKIGSPECVALIAAWCGNVRLIDNVALGE